MKSRPVSVNVTANGLAANQAQQTANQAVMSANKYKMAWDEANSETIAALDEAQKEFESNLAWVKSQIYEGQHQNDSTVASLRSDMESSWNSMSTVEESLYNSAITATSEVDSHLESLRVQNSLSLADLHSTANSLHDADTSLHSNMDTIRGSLNDTRNSLVTTTNDLANVKTSLADTKTSLATATSEIANDLNNAKNSLAAVDNDLRNGVKQASNDLSVAKTSLEATGNSLATTTSELQRQTGQLSGSLSAANSKIEFNSQSIAEVKHTAEEISTTVSNIRVGDRNLARGVASSKDWFVFQGFNGATNYCYDLVDFSLDTLKAGDKVTFGITIKNDGITSGTMYFQQYGNASGWTRDYSGISSWGNVTDFVPNGAEKALTYTITITDGMLNGNTSYTIAIRTDNVPAGGKLSFRYAFVKKGTMATDWTPAPEDTDQAISKVSQTADAIRADLTNTKGDVTSVKATANSLQSSVSDNAKNISAVKQTATSLQSSLSDAQGDISTLKQTASGLTTRVSNAEGNVSGLQQTANKLQSDLTNAKGDISSLQQTANGLTSRVGSAEGNISQLQQTANGLTSTVSNMKSGGANMLPAGKLQSYYCSTVTYDAGSDTYTIVNPTSANAQWGSGVSLPNAVIEVPWGQTVCISMQVYSPTAGTIVPDINNLGDGVTAGNDNDNRDKATFHNMDISADTWTTIWFTYENSSESRNPKKVSLWDNQTSIGLQLSNLTWKIRHPMVQIGTFPSEWSPSPKDTDQAISKVSQTADAIRADLTNTQDDVASVKVTANSLTTQMTNANGNISQLQQTAKGLQSTVTDQSDKLSQLKQDADGISATVGGAAIDLISNLDQPFVMGFGIPSTTWDGHNACVTLPTTSTINEVLPQDGTKFATFYNWEAGKTYMQSIIFETDATVTDGMKWTWYTAKANGHMIENATLVKLGNNTYRLIGSHTPTASEAANPLRVFDIINFTAVVDVTTGTYLKFRNPRIWCPDDNSLAQLKLTADGLTSKVSNAEGNVSGLQQTASKLQSDLTNAKGDISSVKQTADSLTSRMTNAEGNVSSLQQRADSITSTLSNGGVNLLSGTSGDLKNVTVNSWLLVADNSFFNTRILDNKTCTARVWIDKPSMDCILQVWTNKQSWNSNNTIEANQSGYATVTFKITDTSYTDAHIVIGSGSGTVTFSYKELQIEYGDTATPWKPSNGDISSLQQTAEGLTADMKDAKGNISSLQVSASQFTTRLHDAENNVSSLQLTSKELDTQIKGVDGRASTIKETADGISARVSRIEGNNVVGSLLKLDGNEAGLGTYVNNKLIAGINTNPDGVCIEGKNIHLNGQTHIDDGVINASKITVYNTIGDNKGNQYLSAAWGQLNSTIGSKDDQGNSLWGSINQTSSKLTSYYQELKNDGSSTRSLIQQTSKDILLAVDQKVQYQTYTVSASSPWDFNYTKSIYGNWFINGDTSGNYFYNGPDGLKPWVYVQSRGSADDTRFVTTVWRDYDPTQYQRTWTGDHWTPWVMLPNSSNLVSAINLSPDSVKISGKNIELDGNTRIASGFTLSADKIVSGTLNGVTITGSKFVAVSHNSSVLDKNWQTYKVNIENTGVNIRGDYPDGGMRTDVEASLTADDFFLKSFEHDPVDASPNDLTKTIDLNVFGAEPYIRLVSDGGGPGKYAATYIGSEGITSSEGKLGEWYFTGYKVRANESLYVTNQNGTNFDGNGDVGFQVWAGIGLGRSTIYMPGNDLYIQQGNCGPGLGAPYSSSGKVDVHCNRVISQRANSVSSRLSVKTAITKVTYDRALMAVQNTDMYDYRYTSDETGQHYVSGIIDDIHDKPEYNMDPMLINKERTARIDANLLGYHQVVLQEILKRLDKLEAK